jgi:beta-lactamase regulating signal transducer with metallopeptidase domain
LKHELIHYTRKDIWYKLLLVYANAVHWFNPIVYLMAAKANKDVEIVCDLEITKDSNTDYRKKFSETILSAIHKKNLRKTAFSSYFYGGKRTMKERFSNIFDMSKKRRDTVAFLIVLVSITIIGGIVACSTHNKGKDTGNETYKTSEALEFYIMTDQVGAIYKFKLLNYQIVRYKPSSEEHGKCYDKHNAFLPE